MFDTVVMSCSYSCPVIIYHVTPCDYIPAVCRERDELLALVDVQERQRFESLRETGSSADETFYNNFTSIEVNDIWKS